MNNVNAGGMCDMVWSGESGGGRAAFHPRLARARPPANLFTEGAEHPEIAENARKLALCVVAVLRDLRALRVLRVKAGRAAGKVAGRVAAAWMPAPFDHTPAC